MKRMKDYHDLYLKCDAFLLADFLGKLRNNSLKIYVPKQAPKRLICWNANNLYGHGMSKFPQTSGLKRLDRKEFDINKYP